MNWTDFNNVLSKRNISVTDIFYLPFLNNPPTEFDTIFTALVRLVQLANAINQDHIVVTADLAIYSKAKEILWNKPAELEGKVTLMIGSMHLNMAFIASIGYLYSNGGLFTLLTETDIYGANTCKMMLDGKEYSRAIRGLTLAANALSRLFFKDFFKWCDDLESIKFDKSALEELVEKVSYEFQNGLHHERHYNDFLGIVELL